MSKSNILIKTVQEYQAKENRLKAIKDELETIVNEEEIDLANVVSLRDEARTLAVAIKEYLKKTFESKN